MVLMKRFFTLFSVMAVTLAVGLSASADEIVYKSIGQGWMTDDMLTDLRNCQPVTYPVEIEQAEDGSPHYRVLAPYGQTFADAMEEMNNVKLTDAEFDSEGSRYIEIDATNPDDVIFHRTMTGCDWGFGEMFIGINKDYSVILRDGVMTAPVLGIAVGYGDSNSGRALNRRGKFRIVLPGGTLNDFEISITPVSQCLTEREFKGSIKVGSDVHRVRYYVWPNMQEDEMISAVEQVAGGGALFTVRGDFSYDMADVNKETLIVVALDINDEVVGYDWCSYYFIDQSDEGWTDCGNAEYTDGFLQSVIDNIPSQTTVCKMQRSTENPGRYRLVNPYSGLKEYAALNKGHEGHNHYMYINAEDLECIYFEESPIGMESSQYGMMRVSSSVYYYLGAGFDMDECKELEVGAIVEDGVMTFPEEALLFSMMKYENGDWLMTDPEGVTTVKLPEGFSFTAGISNITVDNENAPAEYFDLQGVKIANPESGRLYIRRQGSKVDKIVK